MSSQILNSIGLLLNMSGVVLIFFYGPPQPNLEEGISLRLHGDNAQVLTLRSRHQLFSRIALTLIFLGFLTMLVATWLI